MLKVKWCHQVFPNTSIDILIEVYADLLRSLDPSIPECIEAVLKQHSNAVQLSILLELKQMTRHFAVNLNGAIETSQRGKSHNEKLLSLAKATYAPYVPYVAKYSTFETAQLSQQLQFLDRSHDDLSDTINSLSLSISRIIGYANEANKRCKLFTEGCGYPGLLHSLNVRLRHVSFFFECRYFFPLTIDNLTILQIFFDRYLDKYQQGLRQLERKKVKHEDWNLFQMCLTLMQTIGDYLNDRSIDSLYKTRKSVNVIASLCR